MIILVLLLSALANDATVDRGFRGVAWGETLDKTTLRGTCHALKDDFGCKDTIGEVSVFIMYHVGRDAGLHTVSIHSTQESGSKCPKLLDSLESAYGPGALDPVTQERQWRGSALRAHWSYNEFIPRCAFLISHDAVSAKHRAAEKARAAAAARDDL